jgi:hypothetical protein
MGKSTTFACMAVAAIALVIACGGSSNSSSSGSSVPTCQGPTATAGQSPACNSCVQSNCGSQLSAVESACGPYLSCFEGCQCSDGNCLAQCLSKIDGTCNNAAAPLNSCEQQHCASQCYGTSDAGSD